MPKALSFDEQQAKTFDKAIKAHMCSACQRRNGYLRTMGDFEKSVLQLLKG